MQKQKSAILIRLTLETTADTGNKDRLNL